MKKIFLLSFCTIVVLSLFSCADDSSDTPKINALSESIFHAYPNTVASVRIHVEEKEHIKIILGGNDLYKQQEDKHKQMANDLGLMVIRIFGKGNYLKNGSLTVTKDEHNTSDNPADAIIFGINIDSLNKTNTQ